MCFSIYGDNPMLFLLCAFIQWMTLVDFLLMLNQPYISGSKNKLSPETVSFLCIAGFGCPILILDLICFMRETELWFYFSIMSLSGHVIKIRQLYKASLVDYREKASCPMEEPTATKLRLPDSLSLSHTQLCSKLADCWASWWQWAAGHIGNWAVATGSGGG